MCQYLCCCTSKASNAQLLLWPLRYMARSSPPDPCLPPSQYLYFCTSKASNEQLLLWRFDIWGSSPIYGDLVGWTPPIPIYPDPHIWGSSPPDQIPIYGGPAHQILAWRASIRQHTQHTFCHKAWLLCQYLYVCTSKASKQGVLRSQHYPLNESDVGPPRVALSAVFVLLY